MGCEGKQTAARTDRKIELEYVVVGENTYHSLSKLLLCFGHVPGELNY